MKAQGYVQQTDEQLTALAFGNRFAYLVCTALLAVGVVLKSIPLLSMMLSIAFLGVLLPNHPFDYIYNYLLADKMNKPKLPERSNQLKFACSIATVWIMATIYLFATGALTAGYVMGAFLIGIAFTVGTFDFCIPSLIYNGFYKMKAKFFPQN